MLVEAEPVSAHTEGVNVCGRGANAPKRLPLSLRLNLANFANPVGRRIVLELLAAEALAAVLGTSELDEVSKPHLPKTTLRSIVEGMMGGGKSVERVRQVRPMKRLSLR